MMGISSRLSQIALPREAIYVLRALAEACMLTPWLGAFAIALYKANVAPRVTMLTVTSAAFVIILGTSYALRVMEALNVRVRRRRVIAAAWLLAASVWALYSLDLLPHQLPTLSELIRPLTDLSIIVPASMFVVLITIFVWWRGLRLAQKPLSIFDASIGLQVGVLLFALFLVVASPESQADINPYIIAFFFCQLLAIGLTRIETLGSQPGGRRSPFGNWWFGMLAASTAAVLVVAGIILGIILGVGTEQILRWLAPVLAIVAIPLSIVLVPIIAVLGMLMEALLKALDLTNLLTKFQQIGAALGAPASEPTKLSPAMEIAARVAGYGKGILTLAIFILIVVGVIWAIGRMQAGGRSNADEEHESVWSARQWAARLRRRFSHGLKGIAQAANLFARFGASGLFTAMTIRRIYAQLQKLAAKRGYPREAARTPYEYLPVLYECFAGYQADLDRITEAYVGVHYGELPEIQEELMEIRAAWERIHTSKVKERT